VQVRHLSLTPPESEILTIEFKVNLLRQAVEALFMAEGGVTKPGIYSHL
jgi:hypothetical protein